MFLKGFKMLILSIRINEWIVLRDRKTKKEYGRFKKEPGHKIVFEAPNSTEIRRFPVTREEMDL
jgi:sRNA-binding carbon storage regulator CsrA